jgi:hypothetical protein
MHLVTGTGQERDTSWLVPIKRPTRMKLGTTMAVSEFMMNSTATFARNARPPVFDFRPATAVVQRAF